MDHEPRHDLVQPEGVNAGSASERDRRPSGDVPLRPLHGAPIRDAPPAETLIGPPPQDGSGPGQELAEGEG
jgi:hypothetical protein